jgi:copper(I)-binding protein
MIFQRLLLIGIACLISSPVLAAERASDVVRIENPFARAVVPGMSMSGAFMTFHNDGNDEHLLVAAKSSIAKHVELHAHIKEGGMMRMRQMAHFHLKPGAPKILKPGGLHIMLMGLQGSLSEGDEISIELFFDDGSQTLVKVPVKSISAQH